MAPVKCYYANCIHTNATKSMFTFPINDEPRLKLWIKHSGNMNLTSLTHEELKRRFLCEEHFKTNDVLKHPTRSRLVPTAVPVMFKSHASEGEEMSSPELKVKTPQKVYSRKSISLPMQEDLSPSTSMMDVSLHTKRSLKRRKLFEESEDKVEVKRLKKQVQGLQQKEKKLHDKICRLSLKGSKKKKMMFIESLSFSSKAAKTMATMQLRNLKSRQKWTKAEKDLCLSIYYKSPSAYIHMRRQGIIMAAPSTIRRWLGQTNCLPGLQKDVFLNVEKHFKNASIENRSCVVVFDEMSIMTSLEYSKKYDQIEGFQDYGRGERAPMIAKYVLVFLVRGLYSSWKLPIAYFLSAGNIVAEKLTFLIRIVLNKLFDIGLLPKAIVSDQISTNQKAMKNLGVSPDSPFFHCNGRKIFAFFDIPHALKNIRNNFITSDLTDGAKIFSFCDVLKTYEIDKHNKSKCLQKLTPAHLKPNNFQKMRVKLAAQILSRSVAVAIRTAVGTGELQSETALDTADFIETINYAFDALNSRKKYSKNPYNRVLTKRLSQPRQALIKGKTLLTKLKKILKKKNGSTVTVRPPSFDGFLQSIEAILQMFDEESSGGIKYILTSRLNQDVIENFFAVLRLKAGFNKNPSARVLRTIFRSRLINALMKTSEKKNCLDDDAIYIENTVFEEPTAEKENESEKETSQIDMPCTSTQSQGKLQIVTPAQKSEKVSLEQCSIVYFAGYLAKKCLDTHQCNKCKQKLIKSNIQLNDRNQLLIINKMYPSENIPQLLAPSEEFIKITESSLNIFEEHFGAMMHSKNLVQKLLNCIKSNTNHEILCEEHQEYIIRRLLLVKIYDYCKSQKRNVLENKLHSKLRILKNL